VSALFVVYGWRWMRGASVRRRFGAAAGLVITAMVLFPGADYVAAYSGWCRTKESRVPFISAWRIEFCCHAAGDGVLLRIFPNGPRESVVLRTSFVVAQHAAPPHGKSVQ